MREIKFRVWDSIDKKFYFSNRILACDGKLFALEVYEDEPCSYSISKVEGEEINLWIGMNDKNGKEIYEKDIVRIIRQNILGKTEIIGVVKYNKSVLGYKIYNCFITKPDGKKGRWFSTYYFDISDEIEVVGNIYENPYLLESN